MDKRDQEGHAQIAVDECADRLVAVEVGGPAEPEINGHQHKSRPMSNRNGEGPEAELCRWYSRQRPRMARIDEPRDTERDHQETGTNPDLPMPFDESGQQREG